MDASVDTLLARLDRVRQTGPDRWLACCPAHEDKSPSLSVRALPDGRVLLHDFGGCPIDSVVAALGMRVADLFPDRISDHRAPGAPRIPAGDVLAAIAVELEVVAIAAAQLLAGNALGPDDHERLRLATQRVRSAVGIARGQR